MGRITELLKGYLPILCSIQLFELLQNELKLLFGVINFLLVEESRKDQSKLVPANGAVLIEVKGVKNGLEELFGVRVHLVINNDWLEGSCQ